ncbi:PAS domain S-box-containing protein [Natronorubrum sediminis]|uniref:histidine kinase n=1 Tax=Natronorubrum sediminis TaxID=640943 RepID=A0A1H6G7Z6_9EURY|nr:ATP-binding protein [Natronorubrum sediminis]SEH18104.1 PAS domain S-box-containing protein [Natronorubrum sediminis]
MKSPIRVLYIDGDPQFADLTATRLERADERIEVITESNTADAIELLAAEGPKIDCLITEYELPGMDSSALLKLVRRERDELPIILFTDLDDEELTIDAVTTGITEYLSKTGSDHHDVLADRIIDAVEWYRKTPVGDRSDPQVQELADRSNDVLWMYSADWNDLLFVNAAVEPIFGTTPEQLHTAPTRFLDAVHPEDRKRVKTVMDTLSAGEPAEFEYRINEAEDYPRWVWVQAEPIFDQNGAVDRIVGITRNITAHKERERTLHALNEVAVDLNGCDSAEAIYDRTIAASESLLQFDLSVIDIEEDGYLTKAAISEDIVPMNTTTMSIEEGIAGKTYRTGTSLLIDDIDVYPDANPQGPFRSAISIPIGNHGVFQAVAEEPAAFDAVDLELAELLTSHAASALERLERERRLRHQNERLEEFTRIVSHDLRNPMNVLGGSLAYARENCECECESTHLATAAEELARMETIVEDTLVLAREGQLVDEMKAVHLQLIARTCWGNLETASATLVVADDATIRADRDRLHHVFENLYRNAVEYGGPEVTVRVGGLDGGFYVADDGPGIPANDRERVFDPEYTETNSSGFGLAIVHQVADAHGWTVEATESTAGGARFEFSGVETID